MGKEENIIPYQRQRRPQRTYRVETFPDAAGAIRFRIVDVRTGALLDNNDGKGYKSIQEAHQGWQQKKDHLSPQASEITLQTQVMQWCSKMPSVVRELKDLDRFCTRMGVAMTQTDVEELLFSLGVKAPVPANAILRYWNTPKPNFE